VCLQIKAFNLSLGSRKILQDINLELGPKDKLGIIGESGSGKTMLAKSLVGMVPRNAKISAEQFKILGCNYSLDSDYAKVKQLAGKSVALILQDAKIALNPIMRTSEHLLESLRLAQPSLETKDYTRKLVKILAEVGLGEHVLTKYPHELSGGMAQRVLIASMLALNPQILIADEITSALDNASAHKVLELIATLTNFYSYSTILISHDLELVKKYCNMIMVMYQGRIVEVISSADLENSKDAYTQFLLNARPNKAKRGQILSEIPC
jgi:peptide/nickel transport system ATP-binding protein